MFQESILLKKVKVIDQLSSWNNQVVDIRIANGILQEIGQNLETKNSRPWHSEGACVSQGWLDIGVQAGDPGLEHREDLESCAAAAEKGGFTGVAIYPNTEPTVHSKSEVLYLLNRTKEMQVDFYPIGAISQDCKGKDITEMLNMNTAGAVAFSDGKKSVQEAGLMLRALQYSKIFEGLIIHHPYNNTIASSGQMHEGVVSTSLGLPGIPAMAEELMIERDLHLLEYAGGRLHFANISTQRSVDLVTNAKKKGLKVTASVAAMNLTYTDSALMGFDSNYKVMPPLRGMEDKLALLNGLKSGAIDFISSNHTPLESERKQLEFSYADFGVINLETAFALSCLATKNMLSLHELIEKWTTKPRQILGLYNPKIEINESANLTLFHPDQEWVYNEKEIKSKSRNSPLISQTLIGKVLGIFNNSKFTIHH
jgi:dihydroorotase